MVVPMIPAADSVLVLDSGLAPEAAGGVPTYGLEPTPEGGFRIQPEAAVDACGHGTAVMGVLREGLPEGQGVASLRVLGTDLRTSSQRVLEGLRWGISQGFGILHCSFGTSALQHLPDYKALLDLAYRKNAWIVAASSGAAADREMPAGFPTVFGVRMGAWSDPARLVFLPGDLPEVQAAGQDIRCDWPGGGSRTLSGSSVAAPRLTARLAAYRRERPDMTLWEAKARLAGELQPPA